MFSLYDPMHGSVDHNTGDETEEDARGSVWDTATFSLSQLKNGKNHNQSWLDSDIARLLFHGQKNMVSCAIISLPSTRAQRERTFMHNLRPIRHNTCLYAHRHRHSISVFREVTRSLEDGQVTWLRTIVEGFARASLLD